MKKMSVLRLEAKEAGLDYIGSTRDELMEVLQSCKKSKTTADRAERASGPEWATNEVLAMILDALHSLTDLRSFWSTCKRFQQAVKRKQARFWSKWLKRVLGAQAELKSLDIEWFCYDEDLNDEEQEKGPFKSEFVAFGESVVTTRDFGKHLLSEENAREVLQSVLYLKRLSANFLQVARPSFNTESDYPFQGFIGYCPVTLSASQWNNVPLSVVARKWLGALPWVKDDAILDSATTLSCVKYLSGEKDDDEDEEEEVASSAGMGKLFSQWVVNSSERDPRYNLIEVSVGMSLVNPVFTFILYRLCSSSHFFVGLCAQGIFT